MEETLPRVFLLDANELIATRDRIYGGEEELQAADQRLIRDADQALYAGPFSVVDKDATPPSGDKRDYMSQAPYWWPDPGSADGLPYVRRDGEINPDSAGYDRAPLAGLCSALSALAPAYFFSDLEHFAAHAGLLLRTWFLDEATSMRPHLDYGQAIPGQCHGRGAGIIDTHSFGWLVEMVGLLAASPAWNSDDQRALETWFGLYLDWLLESDHGREEAAQDSNHGTWYDAQAASLALFVGRDEVARRICAESVPERIAVQIEAGGSQPLELARTRSLDYCAMNLAAFFDLADLGLQTGVDLWEYEAAGAGSIRRAFYWLVERAIDGEWPHEQISDFDKAQLLPLLRRGGRRFADAGCEERIAAFTDADADRTNLLYPCR